MISKIRNFSKTKDIKKIIGFSIKMALIVIFLWIFYNFFQYSKSDGNFFEELKNYNFWKDFFGISFLGILFLLINYFFPIIENFDKKILNFIDSISTFLSDNVLINTIGCIALIIIKGDKDISLALVTAYIFYALCEIGKEFKKRNKKLSKIDNYVFRDNNLSILNFIFFLLQFVLNIFGVFLYGLTFSFTDIITSAKDDPLRTIFALLFVVICIAISLYLNKLRKKVKNESKSN